jgi:hypothetical protein
MSLSRNELRLALARGYMSAENKAKPIDIELMEAMLDEVMVVISHALQRAARARGDNGDDRRPTAS